MSSNSDKNISKFQDLLLENEDSPQFDVVLGELLRQAESEVSGKDVSMGEAAFDSFAKNVGLTTRKRWHSALRIVSNIAAVLFIPLLFTCLWLSFGAGDETETVWNEISTAYAENASVELSDGTSVKIGPCSRLIYPDKFSSSERKVFISGDVLFDVAKNPEKKFVAVSDNMDVIVHGTRFHVSSFMDSKNEEVALLNGSVELCMRADGTSVKLVPGDIIRYDKEKGNIKRLHFDVNNYERVLAVDGLQFVDATLSEIVGTLSRRFKVDISMEDSIAGEKYYASFINGENLDEILNALNVERHFRINHINNKIKLTV